jgi:uncharacterized membrane protein YuzA (DUF378 family)
MKDLTWLLWTARILLLIGGFNWGFVGLFNIDIISGIFGLILARLIFILIGVAAGYLCYLIYLEKMKKTV